MIKYVHTNIISEDWQLLSQFYIRVFACRPVPPKRSQSGAWLSKGTGVPDAQLEGIHLLLPGCGEDGPTLEIYSYGNMEDRLPPAANRKGIGHLAFLVDDVPAILRRVLENGGTALGQVSANEIAGLGTITFVYATDPEGNILELQNWRYFS